MASQADFQKLSPGGILDLYEIDLTPLGGDMLYLCNETNTSNTDIIWQNNTYVASPIEAEGFELKGQGAANRPNLKVGNFGGLVGAYNNQYQDMVGVSFRRLRVFINQLPSVNFDDGNPDADPNIRFPIDKYIIERKVTETRIFIEYELAAAWDVVEFLPRRPALQNACFWTYRSSECGYNGPAVADVNDNPTSDINADKCSKKLTGCRLRFGQNSELPYGAFPGLGLGQ